MPSPVHGTFYGQTSTLTQGNLFLVFVTDDAFHLARVADRLQTQQGSPALMYGVAGIVINAFVVKPAIKRREALEARYHELGPGTSEFFSLDARNRTIQADEVASATLKPPSFLTKGGQRVGALQLTLRDGSELKFELSSQLAPLQVERLIHIVVPQVQGSLS